MLISRILTAIALIFIFVGASFWSPILLKILLTTCLLVVAFELAHLFKLRLYLVGIAISLLSPLIYWFFEASILVWICIWAILAILLKMIATDSAKLSVINYLLFLCTIVLMLVGIFSINFIYQQSNTTLLIFLVFVATVDVFGYTFGRIFGKTKIVPSISSGKSLEGYIGSLLAILGVAYALNYFNLNQFYTVWQLYLAAIAIFVFAVIGDLYFSAIKRRAKVKDSGNILPGHGGLLDRFDGYIAASPLFFYFITNFS